MKLSDKKIITSWDDGDPLDLKLAEILMKYEIPGIFYIPRRNKEGRVVNEKQIKNLSRYFEIGGHTLNHVDLTSIPISVAKEEIEGCKKWLEDLLGKKITKFCYPKGKYNCNIIKLVGNAGFVEARTVRCFEIYPQAFNKLEQPTTIKVGKWEFSYIKRLLKDKYFLKTDLFFSLLKKDSWDKLANKYYNKASRGNGFFHLWGHSWEIENEDNWKKLISFFENI